MNPHEIIKSKKLIIRMILGFTLIEYIMYSITLTNLVSSLYEYSNKLNKRVLKNAIAMDVGGLIVSTGIFKLFWIVIILLTILPAISFYQYYIGEKSIYTMLRLPGKGAKLRFYKEQIATSVKGILFIWFWQLFILLTFYVVYVIFVPSKSQPSDLWMTMWSNKDIFQIYPFIKPWFLIPTLSMAVLLPGVTMLAILAERSKKQCVLAILGLMISFYGIFSITIDSVYCVVVVPIATAITLGMGIYYIYKKQIV